MTDPASVAEPTFMQRTRTAYDKVAVNYADVLKSALSEAPLERGILGTFAEYVQADGGGRVADVGCGPGRITTHLHTLGLDVFGIDLSPGMLAVARAAYPEIHFEEGSMTALDLADGSLGGLVAWYSLIHVPPELHAGVLAEFARVLTPGGHLLLAFQIGTEVRHLTSGYGHDGLDLDAYRLSPDAVTELAAQAGFQVDVRVVQEPFLDYPTQQAYLLARKVSA